MLTEGAPIETINNVKEDVLYVDPALLSVAVIVTVYVPAVHAVNVVTKVDVLMVAQPGPVVIE